MKIVKVKQISYDKLDALLPHHFCFQSEVAGFGTVIKEYLLHTNDSRADGSFEFCDHFLDCTDQIGEIGEGETDVQFQFPETLAPGNVGEQFEQGLFFERTAE